MLKNSEPVSHNHHGTLFALTQEESDTLLDQLAERNPELEHLEVEENFGPLTRLTFHPSYSYEDFIELSLDEHKAKCGEVTLPALRRVRSINSLWCIRAWRPRKPYYAYC